MPESNPEDLSEEVLAEIKKEVMSVRADAIKSALRGAAFEAEHEGTSTAAVRLALTTERARGIGVFQIERIIQEGRTRAQTLREQTEASGPAR